MLYFFVYVYNIPCKRKRVKSPELPPKPSKNGQKNNRPLPVSLVRNVQSICHSLICDVTVVAQHLDGEPPLVDRFGLPQALPASVCIIPLFTVLVKFQGDAHQMRKAVVEHKVLQRPFFKAAIL